LETLNSQPNTHFILGFSVGDRSGLKLLPESAPGRPRSTSMLTPCRLQPHSTPSRKVAGAAISSEFMSIFFLKKLIQFEFEPKFLEFWKYPISQCVPKFFKSEIENFFRGNAKLSA
jgi:hypothetical protein